MLKKKMEEWLVKTPEKTERCGMEEELLCRGSSTAWVMEPERKASTQELCLDWILLETSFSRF